MSISASGPTSTSTPSPRPSSAARRSAAGAGTRHGTPRGRYAEIVSAYWTFDCVMQVVAEYDGVVVACYGPHPAIEGIREATCVPTMGIMEASVLYALPLGSRFSIVTTSPRWQPLLEEGIKLLGVEPRCASVRSSGLAVLDLDRLPQDEVCARLAEEASAAVAHAGP